MMSKKLPIASFVLVSILSISIISYSMFLYFKTSEGTSVIDILIKNIEVIPEESPGYFSVKTTFSMANPTDINLRLESIWEELYLNDSFLGENGFNYYPNLINIPPFSNTTTVSVIIGQVHANEVTSQSKYWFARVVFWVRGIPLLDNGARFTRYVEFYQD